MMFHSPTVNGITGWMLRTLATSSSGPTPNRVLFWNGRLIIAATGFCAALARSPDSCASAAEVSGSSSVAANKQIRLAIVRVRAEPQHGAERRAVHGHLPLEAEVAVVL